MPLVNSSSKTVQLGFHGTWAILLPYLREKFFEQVKSIWFIVFYLLFFQIVVLGFPIVHASTIAAGIAVVAIGLTFFMEGLRVGLMPLGETLGAVLPRNSSLPVILGFSFVLGLGATFAEPAITVLRAAGAGVHPADAPLLYSLLNDFSDQLVASVGVGVGCAVSLGVLRFFYGWPLKYLIIPGVASLIALTIVANLDPVLQPILGLAWDCGAVTTGPVTVPLVLALGVGVCRIVGGGDVKDAGFGIVTLASLFPILAVLLLAFYHAGAEDYYGAANYQGQTVVLVDVAEPMAPVAVTGGITESEFQEFLAQKKLPDNVELFFEGGEQSLQDGSILLSDTTIVLKKTQARVSDVVSGNAWDPDMDILLTIKQAVLDSLRAIIPLCLFLLISLKLVLRDRIRNLDEIVIGIGLAVVGMALFLGGILIGLSPLGSQLGSNVPATFTLITPWGLTGMAGPLFEGGNTGKYVAMLFGLFLGYGATLAEPALNALGETVEKITVGAFRKKLLMHSVATGVALGIAAGVAKISFNIPLAYLLIPPYVALLILTMISDEVFVNIAWDSAGVTTGPITVPLVLAMGLGIGANVPGVIDGFGVLALASVGPIIVVLSVGLLVRRARKSSQYVGAV
ncbi:MAG: hypothetical protein ACI9SB_001514 [Candidatus Azotimanducaceae bacterium]|jgi:hypothetical protein